MYENVRERLARVIYRPATNDWDMRFHNFNKLSPPMTNTKLRGLVRRMLKASPGPFLMETQLRREARAILRELRERPEQPAPPWDESEDTE